jgi:UDP-glucose 4-epimerase
MVDPSIDFWEGTYLTQNLLEAIRTAGCEALIYASGSGVYGDTGERAVSEDYAPMLPISPYGASKLACEAMIHAYVHMFGLQARVFRFANVVGPRQSHGVAFDFIRRLREEPATLRILGDGTQSKSYIHVDDIVAGIQYFAERDHEPYSYYNLATDDYLTVQEIADLVVDEMTLPEVKYHYSGGSRGWKATFRLCDSILPRFTAPVGAQPDRVPRRCAPQSDRCLAKRCLISLNPCVIMLGSGYAVAAVPLIHVESIR